MSMNDSESIWFVEPPPNKKLVISFFAVLYLFMGWLKLAPFEENASWVLLIFFASFLMFLLCMWWFLDQGGECGRRLIVDKKGIQLDTYYKGVLQPQSSYKISWSTINSIDYKKEGVHSITMQKIYGKIGPSIKFVSDGKEYVLVQQQWCADPSQSLAFLGIDDKQKRTEVLSDVISAFAKRAQIQVNWPSE